MKVVEIGKHKVEFYSSIKDMPIRKYNQMQNFLMQESGIGNTMADVNRHFSSLDALLISGNMQDALQERQNLQLCIFSALEKINYKSFAFACLIHSIDDKLCNDISDDGLKRVMDIFGDNISVGVVEELLNDLKKNCLMN